MIDIVMTTWGRESFTFTSLSALKENTDYPYRLILIDNGSKGWAQKEYLKMADVYVKLDKNRGLEYAKWVGCQLVESDTFISTDNDILVPKRTDEDWLGKLIKLYSSHHDYRAIALRPQVLVGTGDIFGDKPPLVKEFTHVPGYMRIMDTALTREVGAWKDKRPLRGHEEMWISERFRQEGFKVGWASYIRCWHLFGEENWGYKLGMKPEEHGHNPVYPLPKDDLEVIRRDYVDY
jgi:GT2 family glycosyltransferase